MQNAWRSLFTTGPWRSTPEWSRTWPYVAIPKAAAPHPLRQAPLRLQSRPARRARPLHLVDPHRQRQDRHQDPHPCPVRGLRQLVRQCRLTPASGGRARRSLTSQATHDE